MIEILLVTEHALAVRLPNGHEFAIAFYPPRGGEQAERVVVTPLDAEDAWSFRSDPPDGGRR